MGSQGLLCMGSVFASDLFHLSLVPVTNESEVNLDLIASSSIRRHVPFSESPTGFAVDQKFTENITADGLSLSVRPLREKWTVWFISE